MSKIDIRNVVIGEGVPKVCLPIVGHTQYEIVSQAMTIASLKPDIVEWRADWYDDVFDTETTYDVLKQIRKLLGDTPLLFTFRRVEEGGIMELKPGQYTEINKLAIKSGLIDMIDLELCIGDELIKSLVELAHKNNVVVVVSNHDFDKTPEKSELISRMEKMVELGADIPKIAVMPKCNKDVLRLLDVTDTMHTTYPDIPIITMSMDGRGIASRICGEIFGSSVTFGCARQASAPGQIEANELERAINIVHNNLYTKAY
jgi:3-dehydroquinate dehydratase-1